MTTEAITIINLLVYKGPNVFGPQPGILLRVRCDKDRSRRIKDALKDGAQYIGLVVGYLSVTAVEEDASWIITASASSHVPEIAAALALYVVEGIQARVRKDEEWDKDTPLYDLQRRRRREAAPLPLIQLEAEARSHNLPMLVRSDGRRQIGYGTNSWLLEEAAEGLPTPPWEQIGRIPILAITGAAARSRAVERLAAGLRERGDEPTAGDGMSFEAARDLLTDNGSELAIIGLGADEIAANGLPFDRCTFSAVLDFAANRPDDVLDDQEWAQVLGVPMLVTEPGGCAVLNADEPLIAALAEYAPCPVIYISTGAGAATIASHLAAGGEAFFVRDNQIIAATGEQERALGPAPALTDGEMLGELAALALLEKF